MMKIYRYFYNVKSPFSKITDIDSNNIKEYLDMIKSKSLASRIYNEDYIKKRLNTEKTLRNLFIKKGGKPNIKHPHYFVLENCDYWFYQRKKAIGSFLFDLREFPKDVISFTYGDSIPTFDDYFDDGKEYRKKLYTYEEIMKMIDKYSLPQLWNADCKYGIENYIEVQIWDDKIISEYNFDGNIDIYEKLDLFCNSIIEANKHIKCVIEKYPEQLNIKTLFEDKIFFDRIKELYDKFKNIYPDDLIHGINHAYRTAIYMYLMGKIANVQEENMDELLLTGIAHDIGRKVSQDETHGKISAEMLDDICNECKNINKVKKAITAHSIKNVEIDKYEKKDKELIMWIRDADTLDYIRFGANGYNLKLLKTNEAKRLVKIAIKLNLYMYAYPNSNFKLVGNNDGKKLKSNK